MSKLPKVLPWILMPLLAGCTVFPEKKPPTLTSTTSAEQYERIFWKMAAKQQWSQAGPLLAPNTVWTVPGRTLHRDEIAPYLQQRNAREYLIHDVSLKPNGSDMTVLYTMEEALPDGKVQKLTAVSVWQQVKRGWILIVHSETPQS